MLLAQHTLPKGCFATLTGSKLPSGGNFPSHFCEGSLSCWDNVFKTSVFEASARQEIEKKEKKVKRKGGSLQSESVCSGRPRSQLLCFWRRPNSSVAVMSSIARAVIHTHNAHPQRSSPLNSILALLMPQEEQQRSCRHCHIDSMHVIHTILLFVFRSTFAASHFRLLLKWCQTFSRYSCAEICITSTSRVLLSLIQQCQPFSIPSLIGSIESSLYDSFLTKVC